MARFWILDTTTVTGNWNDTANWSASSGGAGGSSVPGSSDDVVFDLNGISGCIVDAAVDILSLTMTSGYTGADADDGHFDNATNDLAITIGGDVILDNKQVSMGDATWTVSGNWDAVDVATINMNASTLKMDGTTKTIQHATAFANRLDTLEITGTITTANSITTDKLTVSGTYTVNNSSTVQNAVGGTGGTSVTSTGTIDGSATLTCRNGFDLMDGVITVTTLQTDFIDPRIVAGTYAPGTFNMGGTTLLMKAGEIIINAATVNITATTITLTAENPNLTFAGDVTSTVTTWTKGTGTITLSGTSGSQDLDFDGNDIEDVVVNHTGTLKTFTGDLVTDKVTLTAGDVTFGTLLTTADLSGAPAAALTAKFDETGAHAIDTFSLVGKSAQALTSLRSQADANQYDITATADAIVRFLDVKDMNLGGADLRIDRGKDSGNNSANVKFRRRVFTT